MTITEALQIIHRLYEGNEDYPDSTSEDYISRLEKANSAIRIWEGKLNEGIFWKELFDTEAITAGGSGSDAAPADFLFPGGSIWVGSTEYSFVRPEKARKLIQQGAENFYWITGGKGAYKVNTYPALTSNFDFDYYKDALKFTTGDDTTPIEMSDPYFLIEFVLSQLYLDDDNATQAGFYMDSANEKMDAMKLANEMTPFYQDSALEDLSDNGFGT
jgi:hypothetical protein